MCHYSKEHASSWVCNTCCIYALLILSALNKLLLRLVRPSMKQSNIKWQEQALQTETVKKYVQLNCATSFVQVLQQTLFKFSGCALYSVQENVNVQCELFNKHCRLFKMCAIKWTVLCAKGCNFMQTTAGQHFLILEPFGLPWIFFIAWAFQHFLILSNILLSSKSWAYLEFYPLAFIALLRPFHYHFWLNMTIPCA